MYLSLQVLVVGRSQEMISAVIQALSGHSSLAIFKPYLIEPGKMLLPEYLRPVPDTILFAMDETWRQGVWELIEHMPSPRPPLFVITESNDMECLRTAMRIGVRDVFTLPLHVEECLSTLTRVVQEERHRRGVEGCQLIAFMNTKGGSGTSLIASNVAMAMASHANYARRLLLVDFDFQFGGLPTYLNLVARDGLIKAMEFVFTLDQPSLQAYLLRHDSGLHLLAAAMEEIIVPEDISAERTEKLLEILNGAYDKVLIDVPHRIDPAIATILGHANTIALATQQTVAHLHDTKRLLTLLRDHLDISLDRIVLLLNRYDKKAEVRLQDFEEVFPSVAIETIPSDYVRASESLNLGVPICETAPQSPLGQALLRLAKVLGKDGDPMAAAAPGTHKAKPAEPEGKKSGFLSWMRR